MEKILLISLNLNFTPITLGCYGLNISIHLIIIAIVNNGKYNSAIYAAGGVELTLAYFVHFFFRGLEGILLSTLGLPSISIAVVFFSTEFYPSTSKYN